MIISRLKLSGKYIIFFNEKNTAVIAISPEGHDDVNYDGLYRYDPEQIKILGVDLI